MSFLGTVILPLVTILLPHCIQDSFQIWNTIHYTLYTVHYRLYTIHCTLYTVRYTLYTLHCTLYTLHYTLYTIHYTLYSIHCKIYTIHSIIYTIQYALYNIHYRLYTIQWKLYIRLSESTGTQEQRSKAKRICEADKVILFAVLLQNPKCRDLCVIDTLIFYENIDFN